ncbi:MAG: LacI family DNA-binding transcriptional regulator [Chloroflexi bacterium]|jgi:DNA-binding LacI/PurR family transcriptional regulator|nr:LacI family DNA-binding transcriptional regulator [Chloroflexota bacterium]
MTTIKDVAKEAGVSIATVSYVLNDKSDSVSEDTRRRVWSAVRKTGYRPNVTARNLRSNQTLLIGYAWHEVPADMVNPVLEHFTYSLARAAESAGYHILTFTFPVTDPIPVYDELIRTGRVDAFVVGSTTYDDPRVKFLMDKSFPFVSFGRANPEWDFNWVDVDGQRGVADAVDYLAGLGHRKIAAVVWEEGSLSGDYRYAGYVDGLRRAGLELRPEYVVRGEHSDTTGCEALDYWLTLPDPPTAIIASSDLMAIGVINEAERRGIRVGHDLSVVGFDDAPMTQYIRPALTTMQQPLAMIAQELIGMLGCVLKDVPTFERHILLPPRLVVRESCGAVTSG